MQSATIPTIVAGVALAGVVVLGFQQLDAEPAPARQASSGSADSSVRMAALERRITQLEQELRILRTAPREERVAAPERAVAPEVPGEESLPERATRRATEAAAPRPSRQQRTLDRLATDGKISKLTAAQVTQLEEKYAAVRKRVAATLDDIRNNPANEGLDRAARAELMRTGMTALRQDFENDLAAFLPPNDAQVIAQELMSNRGGRRSRGRGRRGREGDR